MKKLPKDQSQKLRPEIRQKARTIAKLTRLSLALAGCGVGGQGTRYPVEYRVQGKYQAGMVR